jgi:hypothetical protein
LCEVKWEFFRKKTKLPLPIRAGCAIVGSKPKEFRLIIWEDTMKNLGMKTAIAALTVAFAGEAIATEWNVSVVGQASGVYRAC